MYVTSKELLLNAQKGKYAVGAFNIENMEMAQAVIEAAEELRAPVILQTTPGTLKYAPPKVFSAIVQALAKSASVPVALHLDHGNTLQLVKNALKAGYSSVMIDGSQLPIGENIALSRAAAEAAKGRKGIPVEAELGKLGGKEDDLITPHGDEFTDPEEAAVFVGETGVDSLAVAIGTAHGFYKGTPVLQKARLKRIRRLVEIPLVLHGASGIPDHDVREMIRLGICKVNFATELRAAYVGGVKQAFQDAPELYDPKVLGGFAKKRVKALVREKIMVCGAEGKI